MSVVLSVLRVAGHGQVRTPVVCVGPHFHLGRIGIALCPKTVHVPLELDIIIVELHCALGVCIGLALLHILDSGV